MQMLDMLANEHEDAANRARMHFAAGMVFDRAGEHDQAFEHFAAGNGLVDASFSPDAHDSEINTLIETFDAEFFARVAHLGSRSETPVFIVGMPRSGTSLVEQIIASHPQAFGAGELEAITLFTKQLPEMMGAEATYPACVSNLDGATIDALSQKYLGELRTRAGAEFQRVTDKMPANFLHLGLIAALFPNAKIIHCRRDPMDTCLSVYFLNFLGNHPYAYDQEKLGRYYRAYERLMEHWKTVLPIEMMELQYEDLIADQRGMTSAMLSFCGLDWDDACLEFHRTPRSVSTSSFAQVRQPIYSASLARWKSYEDHLGPLKTALGRN